MYAMSVKKVEMEFSEDTVNEIARLVCERVVNGIDEHVESGVRYHVVSNDVVDMIANAIREIDECTLNRIEISVIKASGQLYKQVKKIAYEKLIGMFQHELEQIHLKEAFDTEMEKEGEA